MPKNEKIVYVSDTHGDNSVFDKLVGTYLSKHPPDFLILEGDHFTSPDFRKIQSFFYNDIKNPVEKLLKEKPNATDTEIMNLENGQTSYIVYNAYWQLKKFESEISGEKLEKLSYKKIAAYIKHIVRYRHYGLYVSNLSDTLKTKLGEGIKSNVEELLGLLKQFKDAGTSIHIIEGNQDARLPIDYVSETFEAIPLPIEDRVFYAKDFFEQHGYNFYDGMATFETENTIQVLVAYDETIMANSDEYTIDKNIMEFINSRRIGKTVIMTVHGLIDTDIFKIGFIGPNQEGQLCLSGTRRIFNLIQPDNVVIGHYHNPKLTKKIITCLPYDNKNGCSTIIYLPENTWHQYSI